MTYQCRFISCDKGATLAGDVDRGKAVHVWEQGAYGKPLYLPLNFSVNLKLPFKKSL